MAKPGPKSAAEQAAAAVTIDAQQQRPKKLAEPFTLHDIRAKSSSDTESLEAASARLGHASTTTTQRVYRRKPATVKPLR